METPMACIGVSIYFDYKNLKFKHLYVYFF